MKITFNTSIEHDVVARFVGHCDKKQISKHMIIESLMKEWINDQLADEIKMIICKDCGAKYSERLVNCPICEQRRIVKMETAEETKKEKEKNDQKELILSKIEWNRAVINKINERPDLSEDEKVKQTERYTKDTVKLKEALKDLENDDL